MLSLYCFHTQQEYVCILYVIANSLITIEFTETFSSFTELYL